PRVAGIAGALDELDESGPIGVHQIDLVGTPVRGPESQSSSVGGPAGVPGRQEGRSEIDVSGAIGPNHVDIFNMAWHFVWVVVLILISNLCPVGRPSGARVLVTPRVVGASTTVGDAGPRRAIGVHDVDLRPPIGGESGVGDLLPIGRPGGTGRNVGS